MNDYKILVAENGALLAELVVAHIDKGYIPQGGVAVTIDDSEVAVLQAMIKPKNIIHISVQAQTELLAELSDET